MAIDISHADDLRRVYLFVYANFACTTTDVADAHKGMNTRYARELLGALQHGDLITIIESDEGDCWQTCPDTYDTMSTEEAEAKIDKWLGVQPPPNPQNATSPARSSLKSASKEPHPCGCGCGEVITTRSVYRPGHDARHAGQVGRAMADLLGGSPTAADKKEADRLVATLPSDNLKAKAFRIRDNAMAKSKAKPEPEPTAVEGIVQVGKNAWPARRYNDGKVEYFQGKATKTASATATKTFQEG